MALADELQRYGAKIQFISRNLPQYLRDLLELRGMDLRLLKNGASPNLEGSLMHSDWLCASQTEDAIETKQALVGRRWDWLVVDHYALDADWEINLRHSVDHIMVIDDLADRMHECDLLLDQNIYEDMQDPYVGKVPPKCRMLLGPQFALLRNEFRRSTNNLRQRTGQVKRILVFFGGVDAANYTESAVQALSEIKGWALKVDVVIGVQHPKREMIEGLCKSHRYSCHVQTQYMASLMADADLSLGAGGSAMWERCCLGLPTLSVCVAENQRKQIIDAAERGLVYALPADDDLTSMFKNHISLMLENESLRALISKTAMRNVDGLGVSRVAAALIASKIKIREANINDSLKLFEWRNHKKIKSSSRSSASITWTDHQLWIAMVLADKDRALLIGEVDDIPMGVVRFDIEGATAIVSIYLSPEGIFRGQGHNLLFKAEEWLKEHHTGVNIIEAEVLGENAASQRLFFGANYRVQSIYYVKEL